jgi:hypothetical protein
MPLEQLNGLTGTALLDGMNVDNILCGFNLDGVTRGTSLDGVLGDINLDNLLGFNTEDFNLPLLSRAEGGGGNDLSIGGPVLGVDATFEKDGSGGTTGLSHDDSGFHADALDDSGHGRLETLTVHALDTEGGMNFESGNSTYQSNDPSGDQVDANAANGLDGNNLENIFVNGPVDVLAHWNNDNAGDGTQSSANAGNGTAHGDQLNGLGGGFLESISAGAPAAGVEPVTLVQNSGGSDPQPIDYNNDVIGASLFGDGSNSQDTSSALPDLTGVLDQPLVSDLDTGSLGDILHV